MTSDQRSANGVSLAVDPQGTIHFAYADGVTDVTMTHRTLKGGTLSPESALTKSTDDRGQYLELRGAPDGAMFLAFRRLVGMNADVLFAPVRRGRSPRHPVHMRAAG